jgi:hypothetical protein
MCLNVREASIKGSPGTLGNVVPLKGRDETTGYELIKKIKFNLHIVFVICFLLDVVFFEYFFITEKFMCLSIYTLSLVLTAHETLTQVRSLCNHLLTNHNIIE